MARRDDTALQALKQISSETAATLEKLTGTSEEIAGKSSSSLFGALGALVGGTLAYLLSVAVPSISLIELGPMLGGVGLLAPMLAIRGRRHLQLERGAEEQKMILRAQRFVWDEHQDRIKKLPKDTPQDVKNELWRGMLEINQAMLAATMPKASVERSTTGLLPPPPMQLPAPAAHVTSDTNEARSHHPLTKDATEE